jgi:hypothetical protein
MSRKQKKGKTEAIALLSSLKHLIDGLTVPEKQKAWLALEAGLLEDSSLCKQAGLLPDDVERIRQIAQQYNQEKKS